MILAAEFCEHEDLKLDEAQINECKSNMEEFMPEVIKVIFDDVIANDNDICKEAFDTCTDDDYEDYDGLTSTNAVCTLSCIPITNQTTLIQSRHYLTFFAQLLEVLEYNFLT